MRIRILSSLVILWFLGWQASGLDLAVRGKAASYSIVLAKDATAPYKSAASELQAFVEEMTGVKLPVVQDDVRPSQAILIGPNAISNQLMGPDYRSLLKDLKDDSFLLRVIGKDVVILGGKRGAQYGVYELLERFGGCRWYASWHSVIPKQDVFAVPGDLSEIQKPAFLMREPFWRDMFNTMQAIRNKCNGNQMYLTEDNGGKIRFGGGLFVHTFNRLMPPGEFYEQHPEYFSLVKGMRLKEYNQPCLSNPDVLRIMTERFLACIRKDPGGTMFSLSQNDWRNYCECENCQKIVKETGNQAGILIWFVNQVAEAVEKEFPNALVETLAYQYTREPPPNIRPRHNVVPRLCTIECDFARSLDKSEFAQNKKFMADIRGWSSMTDQLFIWDYVTNFSHYLGMFPNVYALQDNVRVFRDNHVIGLMEQGAYQGYHAEFAELRGWLLAKLLWNPEANVPALLDDFFQGYYGKAAPFVREYFEELQKLGQNDPKEMKIFENSPNMPRYTDDFIQRAAVLWEKAEQAVADDPVRLYNVRKGSLVIYITRYERLNRQQSRLEWQNERLVPVGVPQEQRTLAEAILKRYDEKLNGVARPIRLCESQERDNRRVQEWRNNVTGPATSLLHSGDYVAAVAPAMDACLGVLMGPDGYNYINGNAGGLRWTRDYRITPEQHIFTTATANDQAWKGAFTSRNYFKITAEYSMDKDGLHATGTYHNERALEKFSTEATFHIPMNLEMEGNFCVRLDNGPWKEYASKGEYLFDYYTLQAEELSGHSSITFASPKSGRGIVLTLLPGSAPLSRCVCCLDARKGILRVALVQKKAELNGKQSTTAKYLLKPVSNLTGLPASVPCVAPEKRSYLQEDMAMGFTNPGKWADRVADPEAMDGSAIKMYGKYYEWCLNGNADLKLLVPGVKYRLRARIKIEKIKETGNAFWMGVYDTVEKKSYGSLTCPIKDVKNGYQWYDICTWTPNPAHRQWIWAGPGMYGDKRGETNPVEAVYLDRFELVPVTGE